MAARIVVALLAMSLLSGRTVYGLQDSTDSERVLNFPSDSSCGALWVGRPWEPSKFLDGFIDLPPANRYLGDARGSISIPANASVELRIHGKLAEHMPSLGQLPIDGINSVIVVGVSVSANDLASLAKLSSLLSLEFRGCTFSAGEQWGDVVGSANLRKLSVKSCKLEDKDRWALLQWAARCPKLNSFMGELEPIDHTELKLFEQHRAPLQINVRTKRDVLEWISALNRVPHVVAVFFNLGAGVPKGSWANLRFSKRLQYVSIRTDLEEPVNGEQDITPDLIDELTALPELRSLALFSNKPLAAETLIKLSALTNVERLSLSTDQSLTSDTLNMLLTELPNLREFSSLRKPRSEMLKRLAERGNVEVLEIDGLGENAASSEVAAVIRANPLKRLELRGFAPDAALLDAIPQASKLQFLTLHFDNVDCRRLKSLDQLQQLSHLSIDASKTIDGLETLSELPALTHLWLGVPTYDASKFRFVGTLSNLQSLVMTNGVMDDDVTESLVKCKELAALMCLSDCVLSDHGFAMLSQCEHLRSLKISGFLSHASVASALAWPELEYLDVSTNKISDSEASELVRNGGSKTRVTIRPLSRFGPMTIDDKGVWRETAKQGRAELDALEGKQLSELLGDAMTTELKEQLANKVVLIDFWGAWCGPCLDYKPELVRLREQFTGVGFEILAIHSQQSLDRLEMYRKTNPVDPWVDIVDSSGQLAKAFAIPHYPAFYLVDRQGTVRIAQPHRLGMERAVRSLLE